MALQLDHVVLGVHDAARFATSYAPIGIRLAHDSKTLSFEGGEGRIVMEPSSRPRSDLLRACDSGIAHICIQSVEPQQLWRDLAARGMRWNAELVGLGTGYLYAYGYDVEGNLVELEGVGEARAGHSSWLAHIAIVTGNIDRACHFYAALTGVVPHGLGEYSHPNMAHIAGLEAVTARAAWIATSALTLEFWQYLTPPTGSRQPSRPTGYRSLGFVADDLKEELARLRAADITVEVLREALEGVDPDGNRFAIRRRD